MSPRISHEHEGSMKRNGGDEVMRWRGKGTSIVGGNKGSGRGGSEGESCEGREGASV